MTKQEIEKAIENGESVWYLFTGVYELKTSEHTDKFITRDGDYCYTDNNGVNRCAPLDMLYKSKEEAEHYLNHQNITRTEHLPFLTWEDIENYISNMKHFGLNRNDRVLARIITKDSIYYFKLCKDFDLFTFQLKQTYIGEDLCEQIRDKFPVSLGEATEPNFYKAYDECVRLFKGEE